MEHLGMLLVQICLEVKSLGSRPQRYLRCNMQVGKSASEVAPKRIQFQSWTAKIVLPAFTERDPVWDDFIY